VRCGYDRDGLSLGSRCPECGLDPTIQYQEQPRGPGCGLVFAWFVAAVFMIYFVFMMLGWLLGP
jgi:hypothetical protein